MLTTDESTSTLLDFLACPKDQGALFLEKQKLICQSCGRRFAMDDGIPVFLTDEDQGYQGARGTALFEMTPEYFKRLHIKRLNEWGTTPYLSETFQPSDSWGLDVGSGAGTLSLVNARRGIASIGLDISIHGARLGRDNARREGLTNCFFVVGDAVHLPFRANAFRLVTNYTAIEHVYDPDQCLREMHRVTAPGGRVLVNTINNFAWRPENGRANAARHLLNEFKDYVRSVLQQRPVAPPHGASPKEINYDKWRSGEEMDLYHARSYDLLYKARQLFRIELYTSYSYSRDGLQHSLTPDLQIRATPLPKDKNRFYQFLIWLGRWPVLRHMGRTITIIGRKRS